MINVPDTMPSIIFLGERMFIQRDMYSTDKSVGHASQKSGGTRVWGYQFSLGWLISYTNEWEDYPNYFG